jgi:hypothetical protein
MGGKHETAKYYSANRVHFRPTSLRDDISRCASLSALHCPAFSGAWVVSQKFHCEISVAVLLGYRVRPLQTAQRACRSEMRRNRPVARYWLQNYRFPVARVIGGILPRDLRSIFKMGNFLSHPLRPKEPPLYRCCVGQKRNLKSTLMLIL